MLYLLKSIWFATPSSWSVTLCSSPIWSFMPPARPFSLAKRFAPPRGSPTVGFEVSVVDEICYKVWNWLYVFGGFDACVWDRNADFRVGHRRRRDLCKRREETVEPTRKEQNKPKCRRRKSPPAAANCVEGVAGWLKVWIWNFVIKLEVEGNWVSSLTSRALFHLSDLESAGFRWINEAFSDGSYPKNYLVLIKCFSEVIFVCFKIIKLIHVIA